MQNYKFKDQIDAANKLAEILPASELKNNEFIMVCLSLESVILADVVAKKLDLSYELLFSEKITAPNNDECEIAVVSETEEIVINESLANAFYVTQDYIFGEAHRKYEEKILKNIYKFRKGKLLENLGGRNILLIDEGCQTGSTALVGIKTLINLGAKSVFYATAMMPSDISANLSSLVDEIYCVEKIADFVETDFYYEEKLGVNSDEILRILEESPKYLPLKKEIKEK